MTVREFIEKLQKCDQNKTIFRTHFDGVEEWDEEPEIDETSFSVYII